MALPSRPIVGKMLAVRVRNFDSSMSNRLSAAFNRYRRAGDDAANVNRPPREDASTNHRPDTSVSCCSISNRLGPIPRRRQGAGDLGSAGKVSLK